MIKIKNMRSSKGNIIPNQFIINTGKGTYFQSYNTVIAKKNMMTITLSEDWDYSKTTGKYRNIFLRETKQETERKIKSGYYNIVKEIEII